ncbi:pilus assembly protein PilP [Candidatus Thiosymbion oneisti]|uniref:pilus assembly protein PilP n=1 Tax=Candidatus Thiosymbion oneisti TaxID=589554 RepID=UPI000B800A4D|nr:pilus assembly protein PilP [Candidatus Thiosymbion oneisti]
MSPRAYFAVLASMVLVACGNDNMTDLEEYAQRVKGRKPGPIDPLPALEPIDSFSFEPKNRRDPFVPERRNVAAVVAPVVHGIGPDPLRRKEALEQFPLDALTMVGTLAQGGIIWALIKTPDRTLFHVDVGNYMGTNQGRITRITEDEIELTELVSDGGEWHERRATLALSR